MFNILFEDRKPLLIAHYSFQRLVGLRESETSQLELVRFLNELLHLLIRFVVSMVNGSAFQTHHACESLHIVDRCHCGQFGSKAVSSDRGHRDVIVVHEADNVFGHFVKIETGMVVRVAEVARIEEPHVAELSDLE